MTLLEAARAEYQTLAAELARLRFAEAKEISDCARAHRSPGEHYWQPRYNVEQKLIAARVLVEALSE